MRLMGIIVAVAGLACGLVASEVLAGTPYTAKATCPVDGRQFDYTATASVTTFGSELDGMTRASWIVPMPIPQCPDSRFPVYQDSFSSPEQARIRTLVETPEYEAVKDEASYYLLWFVLERLEPVDADLNRSWLMVQATWQVRDDPERYSRYVVETIPLVEAALGADAELDPADWWYVQIVLANLSRQTGDFDAAQARLDGLPGEVPDMGDLRQRVARTTELVAGRDSSPQTPDQQ